MSGAGRLALAAACGQLFTEVCYALLCVALCRGCRCFFFLSGVGRGRPTDSPRSPVARDGHPESYYAVCRLQSGSTSCSGTIVADLGGGRYAITTARHCFGTRDRHGIKVTYWRSEADSDPLARLGVTPLAQGPVGESTASATGSYLAADGSGDFGTVIADLDAPRSVVVVGNGDLRRLSGRKVYAVGCAAGVWPAVFRPGACIAASADSRGAIVYGDQPIAGGQSGGGLFDSDTGYLIAVTNWGGPRGTEALHVSTWLAALRRILDLKK